MDHDKTIGEFDIDIFQMFKTSIDKIIEENTVVMELKKFLDLEVCQNYICLKNAKMYDF